MTTKEFISTSKNEDPEIGWLIALLTYSSYAMIVLVFSIIIICSKIFFIINFYYIIRLDILETF